MIPATAGLRNLVDIARTFEARGSRYMLSDGTLLGMVRDGGFIAWDNDTDLMVPIDGFDPRILRDLHDEGFELTRCFGFPDDGMEFTLHRQGVETDLFFLYPRGPEVYVSAYWWDDDYWRDNGYGTAEWIDYCHPPFEEGWIDLHGHRFRAPADPDSYLTRGYGDSWRLPNDTWDYRTDPPNAVARPDRIDFAESFAVLTDYIRRETGLRLYRKAFWPLPFVHLGPALHPEMERWLS